MKHHNKHYRWDQGWRVRILGLLVFLISLLAVMGMVLSATFQNVDQLQQQADQTRQNVLLMEQASGTFAEMTSALRGYLLTGGESFLQPYDEAKARMDVALKQLKDAAANKPSQLTLVQQVSSLATNWESQVAAPEIAAKRANLPTAGQIVAKGIGQNDVDQIRQAANQYIQSESNRLELQLTSTTRAARNVQVVTWIAVLIAAGLALAGFYVFANSITRATDSLASAAEAIARGERGVVVEATLDGELQEVAEAFTAMSLTLTAQEEELQAQHEELTAQNEELLATQEELQAKAVSLEHQEQRLSRLNRVGQELIGTIEIEQLANLVLDEYLDLFGGSAGALLVAEPYGDHLTVQAERWLAPRLVGSRIPPTGPLARCVQRAELVVANYPDTITRLPVWQQELPVVQETYVPLMHATRVIAVAVIASNEVSRLGEDSSALWSPLARQAAVALAAALNHMEVKRGLQALQEQAAQVEELNAQLEEERDRTSAQLEIYLSIVSSMRAGAWLTDTAGNLLVVNSTFREFFGDMPDGADLETVLAEMTRQLAPHDQFPTTVRLLNNQRTEKAEGQIELTNGYVLQWSSAPVGKGLDPVGRLFTFSDVTELAKLDRLKSEFVNTVSHELRTPLTSIMGYLSLVLNEQVGPLEEQQKEFLHVVMRNTDRLNNLITDLLDIQRIESGRTPLNRRPVQLAEVVQQVAQTFRVAAEQKGLAFEVSARTENMPLINGDPDRLVQIASNLVSNAVKYTREGHVSVKVHKHKGYVQLVVEDTGIGIPAAEQKRIFEKFYRGENRYVREVGGTGLGLSIVKMMVEEHGGEVKVESQPGKGSRFTINFPVLVDA